MLSYQRRETWLWTITRIRGSALQRIKVRLAAVFVVSVLLTVWQETTASKSPFTLSELSVMGLALGIFLGFRNNTSYDRFWEGRKLWGQLVNTSRSLARELICFLSEGRGDHLPAAEPSEAAIVREQVLELRRKQVYRLIAYVHALRMHLRRDMQLDELRPYLSAEELESVGGHVNIPNAINLLLARGNRHAAKQGMVSDFRWVELEHRLVELSNIQGGCERILSTPIPFSYTILIHRIVAFYVFSLPFGLVDAIHWFTPIVVLMVAYTFLGLDAVGSEIEDPFGTDLNDLPLATLSRMIEVNLRQSLGETEVPALIEPVDGYLP